MKEIDDNGFIRYFNYNMLLHRIGMPACIWDFEDMDWHFNESYHRINGKSIEITNKFFLYNKVIKVNIEKLII